MEFEAYPLVRYNPVLGKVEAKTPEDANRIFQPEHNWFKTPEEADQHRTGREADMVVNNTHRVMSDALAATVKDISKPEDAPGGTVMHSVTLHERTFAPMMSPEQHSEAAAKQDQVNDEIRKSKQEAAEKAHQPVVTQDASV